jgi:hypothetical protein
MEHHAVGPLDLNGYRVVDDDDDDPVLVREDGGEIDTWRESYPWTVVKSNDK